MIKPSRSTRSITTRCPCRCRMARHRRSRGRCNRRINLRPRFKSRIPTCRACPRHPLELPLVQPRHEAVRNRGDGAGRRARFSITTDPGSGSSGWLGLQLPPYSVAGNCCGADDPCTPCPGEPPPSCCGDIPFNPATHGCCDGTIYDRVTQGCCDQNFFYGGEEVYTKATQCCESFLLDTKIVTKNPIPFGMIELGFCSGRAQNDRPHEFDGCSAVPSNPAGAPDTAFALEPFHPMGSSCDLGISYLPCDRHDCCYQTCSTNYLFHQAACDFEMWQGMYTVCGASQASFAVVTLCYSAADAYYVGLTVAGGFAHDKRQRQYCDCCP